MAFKRAVTGEITSAAVQLGVHAIPFRDLAKERGITRSAYLRGLVIRALTDKHYQLDAEWIRQEQDNLAAIKKECSDRIIKYGYRAPRSVPTTRAGALYRQLQDWQKVSDALKEETGGTWSRQWLQEKCTKDGTVKKKPEMPVEYAVHVFEELKDWKLVSNTLTRQYGRRWGANSLRAAARKAGLIPQVVKERIPMEQAVALYKECGNWREVAKRLKKKDGSCWHKDSFGKAFAALNLKEKESESLPLKGRERDLYMLMNIDRNVIEQRRQESDARDDLDNSAAAVPVSPKEKVLA